MSADLTAALVTVFISVGWAGAYFWIADRREAREDRLRAETREETIRSRARTTRAIDDETKAGT